MIIRNNYIGNVNQINQNSGFQNQQTKNRPETSFNQILQNTISENEKLKFSKHAEMRLNSRNIVLTEQQKEKITKAVDKAREKGVKETLVVMDDIAFVVSVTNRTVITAANCNELKENVFTNIDGAVFA